MGDVPVTLNQWFFILKTSFIPRRGVLNLDNVSSGQIDPIACPCPDIGLGNVIWIELRSNKVNKQKSSKEIT